MSYLEFVTAGPNLQFSIAAALLLMLFALELVGVLLAGFSLSHIGESIGADGHGHGVGADIEGGIAADALGYLHWGKVPLLVLLAVGLAGFSVVGYGVQSACLSIAGVLLPGWIVWLPALVGAVVATHYIAKPLALLMPNDCGEVLSEADFLGLVGRVTLGPATANQSGEAAVRDLNGREHYIRIKPESSGGPLQVRDQIVITSRQPGGHYTASRIKSEA